MTVLGPVGTVEGFDSFWSAAQRVVPDLVGPDGYPHHRHGDETALRELVSSSGWHIEAVESIVGIRACGEAHLWQWLWGSLPLRFQGGTHLEGQARSAKEPAIREEFFSTVQGWKKSGNDEIYEVRSCALLVSAIAEGRGQACSGGVV
jgi:hypothetical protein